MPGQLRVSAVHRVSMCPIIRYLGFWVIIIIVQVSGKYIVSSTWNLRVTHLRLWIGMG